MEAPTKGTPVLPPRVGHILRLAEIIKEVDLGNRLHPGNHVLSLAEAILAHPRFSGCHDGPAALPAQEQEQGEGLVAELHRMANDAREAGWIADAECLTRWASLEGSRYTRSIRALMALRPTVAAVRAADAAIADEAIEAEFRAWWKANVHPLNAPRIHAVTTHVAWGRHLLSRGEL